MGIFSSKKKHVVNSELVRVFEDDLVPNLLEQAQVRSMLDGTDISEEILEGITSGGFRQFERMYRYAKSGKYHYGLPDVHLLSSSEGFPLAKEALEADVGRTVFLDYLHFKPLNNFFMGWKHLTHEWGYQYKTNEIDALGALFPGVTFYLEKLVAVYNSKDPEELEADSLGSWDESSQGGTMPGRPIPYELRTLVVGEEVRYDENAPESVEIHYCWLDEAEELQRGVHVLDLSGYDSNKEYYQARYWYQAETKYRGYWFYDPATNTHEELSKVFDPPDYTSGGTYFPFALFRSNKTDRTASQYHHTHEFQSTKTMLKMIGMDFEAIGKEISNSESAEDIAQAAMVMAAPMNTKDPIQIEYLFNYFLGWSKRLPEIEVAKETTPQRDINTFNKYALRITDGDLEMIISFDDIHVDIKPGTLSNGEEWENTLKHKTFTMTPMASTLASAIPRESTAVLTYKQRTYSHQLYDGVVAEVTVRNPMFRYVITEMNHSVEGEVDDERLMIPLDYEICRKMNVLKREDLYTRSLYLMFNTHQVIKIAFWQRGAFKVILAIVIAVITFFTAGAGSGLYGVFGAAVAAVGSSLAIQLLIHVVMSLLQSLVISLLVDGIVEIAGPEFAAIVAIVMIIYGGYKALQNTNWLSSATGQALTNMASNIAAGANRGFQKDAMEAMSDMNDLNTEHEEKMAEVQELIDALDTGLKIDPFEMIRANPLLIPGEDPDTLYNRTVHSGNIGVKSLDFVQHFVAISCRLPDAKSTLNGI